MSIISCKQRELRRLSRSPRSRFLDETSMSSPLETTGDKRARAVRLESASTTPLCSQLLASTSSNKTTPALQANMTDTGTTSRGPSTWGLGGSATWPQCQKQLEHTNRRRRWHGWRRTTCQPSTVCLIPQYIQRLKQLRGSQGEGHPRTAANEGAEAKEEEQQKQCQWDASSSLVLEKQVRSL
jgi:hypothetical protein